MSAADTAHEAGQRPDSLIDQGVVGYRTPPHTVLVEAGRLRQFARAIGENRAKHADESAALAAGLPGLPVPPTFLFCLEMERPDPWDWIAVLGVDLESVLHAEQSFVHHRPVWSGDRLRFDSHIAEVTAKAGGALQFVVRETRVTDEHHAHLADLRTTLAVVHR